VISFLRGWALIGLVLVPIAILLYLWMQRRKRKYAVQYASLSLIREARPGSSRWRRHVPFALLLASMAALVLALARPETTLSVPEGRTSIILALDVSRSMCSTDVDPNRLAVAQEAAQKFVDSQPKGTRLGLVAFAGTSQLLVPPTTDKDRLHTAIDELTTSIGTAIGNAVLTSIDALAEVNAHIEPSTLSVGTDSGSQLPKGAYEPDIIVLLTDGANTRGVEPLVAAQQAADRRVRVYTIGFGTTQPGPLVCTSDQLGGGVPFGDQFGGPVGIGPGGPGTVGQVPNQFVDRDEPTLRGVAEMTGGEYYSAENADQLVGVFDDLPRRVVRQDERREISAYFALLGALLVVTAFGLSMWWNRYP
jgi:Ca-activated chloride channel family protein